MLLFSVLLIACVLFSKLSDKYGIPALLIFLAVGMIAGSDGLLGIYFDNQKIAQDIGTVALILILYSGGLDTSFKQIKPIVKQGVILATLGVVLTAFGVGVFVYFTFNFTFYESCLIGAIISSTDAAAVFAILRSRGIRLKNNIQPLLELESGSNDPMAIFLTIAIISIITTNQSPNAVEWIVNLILQFSIGGLMGYAFGAMLPSIFNKIKLSSWGLYPVFSIAWVFLLFSLASVLNGNGFIAVYIAGIYANKRDFIHKKNLIGFHDGTAWMMQILIFITLGLLVFPKQLPEIALMGFSIAIFLMFVARPIGVFISLIFSKYNFKEKLFISWVGLRGVVPIVLATYPFASDIKNANLIFNVIFFIVLASVLIQGTTLSFVAKKLDIKEDEEEEIKNKPIFYGSIKQYTLNKDDKIINKSLIELELPDDFLIILVERGGKYLKPSGSFIFQENDLLLILCEDLKLYQKVLKNFEI